MQSLVPALDQLDHSMHCKSNRGFSALTELNKGWAG